MTPENRRKILVTGGAGGLGNIFTHRFVREGYTVRVFDLPTPANKKLFTGNEKNIEVFWGDITREKDVMKAMEGTDIALHLAAILVPNTEKNPELAHRVNVGGTELVARAAAAESEKRDTPIPLLFSSSVTVYGHTHDETPPITQAHPLNPTDNYSETKIKAEEIVSSSGLPWTIFRFAATLYLTIRPGDFGQMRMIPPDNRIEIAHLYDVCDAIVTSLELDEARGKVFVLGGGPKMQMLYREQIMRTFDMFGFPAPNWKKFTDKPFYLDWYDTEMEQRILRFQKRDFDHYLADFKKGLGMKYFAMKYLASPPMKLLGIHI